MKISVYGADGSVVARDAQRAAIRHGGMGLQAWAAGV
jgi:hypothetical protein